MYFETKIEKKLNTVLKKIINISQILSVIYLEKTIFKSWKQW